MGLKSTFKNQVIGPMRRFRLRNTPAVEGIPDYDETFLEHEEADNYSHVFAEIALRARTYERQLETTHQQLSEEVSKRKLVEDQLHDLEAEANKYILRQNALHKASMTIASTLDEEEVIQRITEQLCKAVDATSTYILDTDIETGLSTVISEYFSVHACEKEMISDLGESYGEVDTGYLNSIADGITWVDHVNNPNLAVQDRKHMQRYGAKSIMYIPLYVHSKVVAVAEVWETRNHREFKDDEIKLCSAIAQNAAIALENARFYNRAQRELANRARIEISLRESEERYSLAASGANDGLWDWILELDQIYYSLRWKVMLGYAEDEIEDNPQEWFNRIHPDDLPDVQQALGAHFKGHTDHFEKEYRMIHSDGSYRWVLTRGLAIRDSAGNPYRIAGSQTDITARKIVEEQLTHAALHDSLTGLPNRTLFLERMERAIEQSHLKFDYKCAVLFMDFDRFKYINDSLGHMIGDQLLIALADVLKESTRESDTVARLGGDEFVILLDNTSDQQQAIDVVQRIQENLSQAFCIDNHAISISSSIGIILIDGTYECAGDVLRDADIAMYSAKDNGRDQYVLFTPEMRNSVLERMQIENELRKALAGQEFHLNFQPILSLQDGRLTGFEALIRWKHPEMGMVAPNSFISIAEETRLIVPIGSWVLNEACQQLSEWQSAYPSNPPLTMSVNISRVQLVQHDFVNQLQNVLVKYQIDPEDLILEITESVILMDDKDAAHVVPKIRALGVKVHIDDFGTGYSSLGYLQRYPIDIIKMDRSFVGKINGNGENVEIIKAILNLSRELNIGVIAEGIETEKQLQMLKNLGCEFGQGYYLSRPQDQQAIERLLNRSSSDTSDLPFIPRK